MRKSCEGTGSSVRTTYMRAVTVFTVKESGARGACRWLCRNHLLPCASCTPPVDVAHDAISPAATAELHRAAGGGLVPYLLAGFADVSTVGQPPAAESAAAASSHRREGRRAEPRQADTAALRPLGGRRCAR